MDLIEEEQGEQSENGGKERVVEVKEKPRRPPHNYMGIVKDAHPPFDTSSLEKICRQLYDGVLLRDKKQKYWVDRESNKNCFMVLARDLAIAWGGERQFWDWAAYKESVNEEEIEVAMLKGATGFTMLDISGKFRTIGLTPGTVYEAAFVVKMLKSNIKWASPVKLSVTPPNGENNENLVDLNQYRKNDWVDIRIGEFTMLPENVGEVTFSLQEPSLVRKGRMVLKGVSFRPKK